MLVKVLICVCINLMKSSCSGLAEVHLCCFRGGAYDKFLYVGCDITPLYCDAVFNTESY